MVLLGLYLNMLKAILRPFRVQMEQTLEVIDRNDPVQVERAVLTLWRLIRGAREQAVQVGNGMLTDTAAEFGYEAYLPEPATYTQKAVRKLLRDYRGKSDAALIHAMERHVRAGARTQIMRAVPDPEVPNFVPIQDMVSAEAYPVVLEGFTALDELIEQAGQDADQATADAEGAKPVSEKVYPIGWARVLTGETNCGFCVMLASRGPVYSSKLAASYKGGRSFVTGGRGRRGAAARRHQAADKQRLEDMNAFHDSCDCIVVPVYKESNWVGKAEYERLRTLWDETVKKAATNPDAYKGNHPRDWVEQELTERAAAGSPVLISNKRDEAAAFTVTDGADEQHLEAVTDELESSQRRGFEAQAFKEHNGFMAERGFASVDGQYPKKMGSSRRSRRKGLPEVQEWQWPPPGVETVPRASVKVPEYRLTDEDMRHIWEGEPNGLDGGHRPESTHRNKVKFPPGWTKQRAQEAVQKLLDSPDMVSVKSYGSGTAGVKLLGVIDDILLHARLEIIGSRTILHAAFPMKGVDCRANLADTGVEVLAPLNISSDIRRLLQENEWKHVG